MRRLLSLALCTLLLPGCVAYEIRDELKTANNTFGELGRSRQQLEESNVKLEECNRQLAQVNRRLTESSRRLEVVEQKLIAMDRNLTYISSAIDTVDRALPIVKVPKATEQPAAEHKP